jgi:hypothetical protein
MVLFDATINLYDAKEHETFVMLDGRPREKNWKPIKVRRGIGIDSNHTPITSDFPWLGSHALVFSSNAVDALRDILEPNGELLPLNVEGGSTLFAFNSKVIDALDETNSLIKRIPGTNKIMQIKKPVFIESKIQGLDIFRLPHRASVTYVSEHFVKRVKAAGLKGLTFTKVYDSAD